MANKKEKKKTQESNFNIKSSLNSNNMIQSDPLISQLKLLEIPW
jgi:hypothetical protein